MQVIWRRPPPAAPDFRLPMYASGSALRFRSGGHSSRAGNSGVRCGYQSFHRLLLKGTNSYLGPSGGLQAGFSGSVHAQTGALPISQSGFIDPDMGNSTSVGHLG